MKFQPDKPKKSKENLIAHACKCSLQITDRLGDVVEFENRQPEPKLNKITNDEDKYKSSIVKVKPGLLPNSEQKAEYIFVAPPYCQTSCWQKLN